MKKYFILLLTAATFIYTASAFAQIQQTSEALERLEKNVTYRTLSNGLRVILYPRPIAPVFSGVVITRVGGSDELTGQTGIAHMLEHMAFKGTDQIGTKDYKLESALLEKLEKAVAENDLKAKEDITSELRKLWITDHFTREYDKRGASGLNAFTSAEMTAYFVDLPRSSFEFWCYMESERILNPVMRQFYEERDVVLEERRMRYEDDPGGKLYETLLSKAFLLHPYGKPVIGFESDLRNLTATAVKKFHQQYYIPSEMVLSLAGDINPEKDLTMLEKYFGRIPASSHKPYRPEAREPVQTEERSFSLETDNNPEMMVAYHKPVFPDTSDPVITVLSEVLTGSRLAPLRKILVEEKKLAISVSSSEAPGNAYPNLLVFSITPKAPHTNLEVLAAFDEELEKFKRDWNDQELLDNAKRSVAMSFLANLKSNQGIAMGLASDLTTFGTWKASSDWFSQAMKVDLQQIKDASLKYLTKENRTIGRLETK